MSDHHHRRDDQDVAIRRRRPAPPVDRGAWFSDEIAIDFPSIREAVERMRESFLADDDCSDGSLSAEIQLSTDEACCGVTVPLDVPVRSTCPLCDGRGESWMEACSGCGGTGAWRLPHRVQLMVPAGVADGECFRFTVSSSQTPPTHVEVRITVDSRQ